MSRASCGVKHGLHSHPLCLAITPRTHSYSHSPQAWANSSFSGQSNNKSVHCHKSQSFFKRKSRYEHLRGPIFSLQRLQLKTKLATKAHHTPITQLSWLCFSHSPVHVAPQSICSCLPFMFAFSPPTLLPIHLNGNLKAFLDTREISMLRHYNSIGFTLTFWGKSIFIFRMWPSGLSWTFKDKRWPTSVCFSWQPCIPDIRWVYRS